MSADLTQASIENKEQQAFFQKFNSFCQTIGNNSTSLTDKYNYANQLLTILRENSGIAQNNSTTIAKALLNIVNIFNDILPRLTSENAMSIKMLILEFYNYLSYLGFENARIIAINQKQSTQDLELMQTYNNMVFNTWQQMFFQQQAQTQQSRSEIAKLAVETARRDAEITALRSALENGKKAQEAIQKKFAELEIKNNAELGAGRIREQQLQTGIHQQSGELRLAAENAARQQTTIASLEMKLHAAQEEQQKLLAVVGQQRNQLDAATGNATQLHTQVEQLQRELDAAKKTEQQSQLSLAQQQQSLPGAERKIGAAQKTEEKKKLNPKATTFVPSLRT